MVDQFVQMDPILIHIANLQRDFQMLADKVELQDDRKADRAELEREFKSMRGELSKLSDEIHELIGKKPTVMQLHQQQTETTFKLKWVHVLIGFVAMMLQGVAVGAAVYYLTNGAAS